MKHFLYKTCLILALVAVVVFAAVDILKLMGEEPPRKTDVWGQVQFEPEGAEKIVYGTSGMGRELVAWQFGKGRNVLVLTFAVHGYEDAFEKDGAALVYTANELMKKLPSWKTEEWSIYVLPCCNPDGLLDGTTNEGFGRCTGAGYLADGTLSPSVHADINRCFPVCWEKIEEPRFYNGFLPLACPEAEALAEFLQEKKGEGVNFCIDVHGWYRQTLTSSGKSTVLYKVFNRFFPDNTWADVNVGTGYLAAYAAVLGYDSALFEFPSDVESMEDFENSGYAEDFAKAIKLLVSG